MKPRSERLDQAMAVPDDVKRTRPRWFPRLARAGVAVLMVGGLLVVAVLRYGGRVLVAPDPLPEHADVAIVLNGSFGAVAARRAEAVKLLQEGRVDHVMLSVGAISYYGEWLPDLVRRFVRREYGDAIAERLLICEGLADSTAAEMIYLRRCLESTDWRSAVVVTSDFHTRRTSMIVASTLAGRTSVQHFAVRGVADGTFAARGWWKNRRYAKMWLFETTKLLWFFVEEVVPGGAE